MALPDLSSLDQYAATPFPSGFPADHRTLNAPGDNVVGALETVVGSASSSQVLAMYSFTHPSLVAAFAAKVKAGIPSLCVLDRSEFDGNSEKAQLPPLLSLFGSVYPNFRLSVGTAENGHGIMHRKVYICDGSLVVTGSFNWTLSATKEDNQCTIGLWPADAELLTASIEATYAFQMAHQAQPAGA